MKVTLLSNCGLALEQAGAVLLIDALNKQYRCYYGLPAQTFADMLAGAPPFDGLCGILYTHDHPDHYNAGRTEQLHAASGAPVFVPRADTPPQLSMQCGSFRVEFYRFAHIPVPGLAPVDHGVYLISAAGKSVYVTADAQIDEARHREILNGRKADAAFWNGQPLSYPQMRAFFPEAAEKNYVYHIPVDERDACGIRRKCERNLSRYGTELAGVCLLEQYPSEIIL